MATLTEFLLARIAEDEAAVSRFEDRSSSPHASHGSDSVGTFARWCPTCLAGWPGRERFLAECEAKRQILREIITLRSEPAMPEPVAMALDRIAGDLALAWADRADYQREWKPY